MDFERTYLMDQGRRRRVDELYPGTSILRNDGGVDRSRRERSRGFLVEVTVAAIASLFIATLATVGEMLAFLMVSALLLFQAYIAYRSYDLVRREGRVPQVFTRG